MSGSSVDTGWFVVTAPWGHGRRGDGRHVTVAHDHRPAYGVAYDRAGAIERAINTSKRIGKVENDHRADWREAWASFPGRRRLHWQCSAAFTTVCPRALPPVVFNLRAK